MGINGILLPGFDRSRSQLWRVSTLHAITLLFIIAQVQIPQHPVLRPIVTGAKNPGKGRIKRRGLDGAPGWLSW